MRDFKRWAGVDRREISQRKAQRKRIAIKKSHLEYHLRSRGALNGSQYQSSKRLRFLVGFAELWNRKSLNGDFQKQSDSRFAWTTKFFSSLICRRADLTALRVSLLRHGASLTFFQATRQNSNRENIGPIKSAQSGDFLNITLIMQRLGGVWRGIWTECYGLED